MDPISLFGLPEACPAAPNQSIALDPPSAILVMLPTRKACCKFCRTPTRRPMEAWSILGDIWQRSKPRTIILIYLLGNRNTGCSLNWKSSEILVTIHKKQTL
uniref:Uncharacterized protein n=1 Tax=Entomoneis paludosa TaxID=265537 RepID=A0A7S3DM11_9STRA|mmetsp:Transcript_20567/g.43097  ORF Transcript_20567/g.43097 Transcript_20567/m.43097 type:complete len:102 (+) Transcript_20567:780-1085(+)